MRQGLVASNAKFSSCGQYRYWLTRRWKSNEPIVAFIGLNPSTADAENDDPTIRRCMGYARAWGFGGLVMLNLFAFKATSPKDMLAARDPIGPDNDRWIAHFCADAPGPVVAAWGTNGTHLGRDAAVRKMLKGRLSYLKLSKDGHPCHPLYLPKELEPVMWY